jgi:hypothetical protein
MSDQDFSDFVTQSQQTFAQSGGLKSAPKSDWQQPNFGPKVEQSPEKMTNVGQEMTSQTIPQESYGKVNLGDSYGPQDLLPKTSNQNQSSLSRNLQSFLEPAKNFVTNLFNPSGNKTSSTGVSNPGWSIPDFNIAGFKLPSFSMSNQTSMPSSNNLSSVGSSSNNGPTMQPSSGGFGEKIKSFGQRVVGSIKSLLHI